MRKRILRFFLWTLGSLIFFIVALFVYVRLVSRVSAPSVGSSVFEKAEIKKQGTFKQLGNNWFRKSENGWYELYVEGQPFDRGIAIGRLTDSLIHYQEEVFQSQIRKMIPSAFKQQALRYLIGWFNRNLDKNIPEEFKLEIYGSSLSSSHRYDDVASPYQRALNYHAAHDIGHAVQNMSLVGCTSFATWGSSSEDSTLIIGRNFDFFVDEDFAKNKIIAFYKPSKGYAFAMITFPGMTGALSAMNSEGLTITLNAAKSEVPTSSATPVSLLAREILQYATTISEAYEIAKNRKTFVAETFLIGSAKDGRAAVIEKSTDKTGIYESSNSSLICTNHFQSPELSGSELNQGFMKTSSSVYRYERVQELLNRNKKNSVTRTAAILRDRKGKQDSDIGLGNEKSIDQLIAHHGIIFQPQKRRFWVSASQWVLGKFVCYDLDKVFNKANFESGDREISEKELAIENDSFLKTDEFKSFLKFSPYRYPFACRGNLNPDSVIKWNQKSYFAYMLAGDFYKEQSDCVRASENYSIGLTKEVATLQERKHMEKNKDACK